MDFVAQIDPKLHLDENLDLLAIRYPGYLWASPDRPAPPTHNGVAVAEYIEQYGADDEV